MFGKTIGFDSNAFFYFILPPIIFASGYSINRATFLPNLSYILGLGIFGTIFAVVILAMIFLTYKENYMDETTPFHLFRRECFLLASVLCATDTIAVLTIVKESSFPVLNALLFGEGVVNDAVSILVYRAVEGVIDNHPGAWVRINFNFTLPMISNLAINFVYLSFTSVVLGVMFGLAAALLIRNIHLI